METYAWIKNNSNYSLTQSNINVVNKLPKGIYTVQYDERTDTISLEKSADKFEFGYKIYGKENTTINHIMNTFRNSTFNFGMLFNGTKGTGKTVTAKLIANEMELPVILCDAPIPNLEKFLMKINSDCIFFFDEFEKNFKADEDDAGLLSLMDGAFESAYRRIFILTTNYLNINTNILGRPSRIRYRKNFGNLEPELVKEYIEDNLNNKEYAKELCEFINTLEISTMDILKSLVDELNIHNVPINEFKDIFNVEVAKYTWRIHIKWSWSYPEDSTLDIFKKEVKSIGNIDENGMVITRGRLGITEDNLYTNINIAYLQCGDILANDWKIISPIDEEGFMSVQDRDVNIAYIKVLNIDSKPSLYQDGLLY